MTKEEAIKEIMRAYDVLDFSCHMDNRRKESFNMAKVALEQESILDKIRAEINEEYKDESEHPYGQGLRRALQIIDKYNEESEKEE